MKEPLMITLLEDNHQLEIIVGANSDIKINVRSNR